MSQQDNKQMAKYFYRASAADFKKIPGSPVAYWVSQRVIEIFSEFEPLSMLAKPRQGLATSDNDRFLKQWFEVAICRVGFGCENHSEAKESGKRWFPCQKGGPFKKWYGNNHFLVNWENDGQELLEYAGKLYGSPTRTIKNIPFYFKEGMTWSTISSSSLSMRYSPKGFISETKGAICFADSHEDLLKFLGFCNSTLVNHFLAALSPTLDYHEGPVGRLPITKLLPLEVGNNVDLLISIAKIDWDAYEFSWDFKSFPLINLDFHQPTIKGNYQKLRTSWSVVALKMQRFEEENNRIFIDSYGLQDELTPEVPLSDITLTCNPHYRYGGNLTEQEREDRLQSDTIAELISYTIGCMMGRYSLDQEGLVYANAGNIGFSELVAEGAYQTFHADSDGILPLTSEHWFDDDVAARVEEFVRTVWGTETLEENLQFIADSLCLSAIKPVKKSGETAREIIRRYLSTQFFKDHLKTYKKRPIYWLFSSGKEKAFECLVYLHRYNEATLPRMRTEYVTPLLGQMAGRIERLRLQKVDAATAEAKRLDKEIDSLTKQLTELRAFDDQLKHYADMKITLDLDDGVKVNYGKFGNLLAEVKAITGDKGE